MLYNDEMLDGSNYTTSFFIERRDLTFCYYFLNSKMYYALYAFILVSLIFKGLLYLFLQMSNPDLLT